MKRLIVTAAVLALPPGAQAKAPTRQHRDQYTRLYRRVAAKLGRRAPGRNILRWGLSSGHSASDTVLVRSIAVLGRMLAPPPPVMPAPVATTTSTPAPAPVPVATAPSSSAGGLSSVPGVPASFAACVAMRESTNGAGSSNIYGILGPGGQGSLAEQKQAFSRMYAQRGVQPWQPYDHC